MSYFLKITNKKQGKYLQIYDSKRVKGKKYCESSCYKTLGFEEDLKTNEILDPISFYKEECKKLNEERNTKKQNDKRKKIGEITLKNIGFSLPNAMLKAGKVDEFFKYMSIQEKFRFNAYEIFSDFVASRIIRPCSKLKTYNDVMPALLKENEYSLDNMYDALYYFGENYDRIIEILQEMTKKFTKIRTNSVYFDCTNFYFEIDKEDDLRKKGPSKENRRDPIIGMGLLLDANTIPVSFKLYPGNESEKPVIREIIEELKTKNKIHGRTIQVADKGLNCAKNIYEALIKKDGYIFSKSVLKLAKTEKNRVFNDVDYEEVTNEGELVFKIKDCVDFFNYEIKENGKVIKKFKVKEKRVVYWSKKLHDKKIYELTKMEEKIQDLCLSKAKKEEFNNYASYINFEVFDKDGELVDGKITALINKEKFENDKKCAGYNLIVSSERKEDKQKIYDTYHNLWKIEETFRIMKSELNARPVYVRKRDSIYGHFIICYTAVLILRLLQYIVFKNNIKTSNIVDFISNFNVIKIDERYLNALKKDSYLEQINEIMPIDVTNLFLTDSDIKKLQNFKLSTTN